MSLTLAELQREMVTAIYGQAASAALQRQVRARPGVHIEGQLDLYRRGTQAMLQAALKASYPAIARLVGVPFFDAMAREFVLATPSHSGDLEHYGAGFGDFLDGHPRIAALPYLVDVARLEWQLAQLRRAPMLTALDRDQLAALPTDRIAEVRLTLLPHAALFCSPFPVWTIWQKNCDPACEPQAIDLDSGGDCLLLCSGDDGITAHRLSAAAWIFFDCFSSSMSLTEAAEAAWATDPSFDLTVTLGLGLESGVLSIDSELPPSLSADSIA